MEGDDSYPAIEIDDDGVQIEKTSAPPMRSDNDWLMYNLEALELAIADFVEQTESGKFSRLVIRDGSIDMLDPIYGLYRSFSDVQLDIAPVLGQERIEGQFSAQIGGRRVFGTLERSLDADGTRRLQADITNIDYAAIMPFLGDAENIAALEGTGALSIDVTFEAVGAKIIGGEFKLDLTGIDLRIEQDRFPVVSSILTIDWEPEQGQFVLQEGRLQIGESSANVSGVFAMGLDEKFGPTMGVSLVASDVFVQPEDLPKQAEPFDRIALYMWSAPLYGAMGIDSVRVEKGEGELDLAGRLDMVQAGSGMDLSITGKGISAEDMVRLWPYITAGEARDWVVKNVEGGVIESANMRFKFPVGSIGKPGEELPLPKDAIAIELVGSGVVAKPLPSMETVHVGGTSRVRIHDKVISYSGGMTSVATTAGSVEVINPGFVLDSSRSDETVTELSGDVIGSIPAVLAFAREHQPALVGELKLPLDLDALSGELDLNIVATMKSSLAVPETPMEVGYVLNGQVLNFASKAPIEGRVVRNGTIKIAATQAQYQFGGTAEIDGMAAELFVEGTPTSAPKLQLGGTMSVAELKALGIDVGDFVEGEVKFLGKPMSDGGIELVVDLEGAAVNVRDLGVYKSIGRPGALSAIVRLAGDTTKLEDLTVNFGTVRLRGKVEMHKVRGLVAAEFSTFQLNEGDSASVTLAPLEDGYSVRVRGAQLDLKPLLGRFFGLEAGAGGVSATQVSAPLAIDVELERALGQYAVTAFNLDLDMLLRGSDLRRATLAAQFTEGNGISITTNPAPNGRTLTVAFNDAGTILRMLGIYSQLAGGAGSLVMTTDRRQELEVGQLMMRNFAIVDEDKVIQVLGNHADSRDAIGAQNRLDFTAAQVDFIRRKDRVEVSNAVLAGPMVGGTMRGNILTDRRQYDLVGTYVPLFGINNVFQQLPVIGQFLGGRDGEGLVGVTFAVNGPLDKPAFSINPLSVLAPGFLRELFEFRSRELPAGN